MEASRIDTGRLRVSSAQTATGVRTGNIHTVKFQSAALGQEHAFHILLPDGYEKSPRRYPVLYLLHGLGDNHMMWRLRPNVSAYAEPGSVMVVMPDASRSFYVNSAAIGAFSGALGASHDGSESKGEASLALRRRPDIETLFGAPGSVTRRQRDPFLFVARGGQDFLIAENRAFVELLARKGLAYEYREISPRGHSCVSKGRSSTARAAARRWRKGELKVYCRTSRLSPPSIPCFMRDLPLLPCSRHGPGSLAGPARAWFGVRHGEWRSQGRWD